MDYLATSKNRFLHNRSPILGHSKMQKTTALSTAEGPKRRYYSASTAATEVLYLRYLLESMGFVAFAFAQPSPTPVYEDKTARI